MTIQGKTSNQLSIKWPLLFWSGAILILIAFPFFLLEIGLQNFLELKRERQKQDLFRKLDNKLGFLIKYKEPRHYYHSILHLLFDRAKNLSNPIAYLKNEGFKDSFSIEEIKNLFKLNESNH